jgi:hypothetical protein
MRDRARDNFNRGGGRRRGGLRGRGHH